MIILKRLVIMLMLNTFIHVSHYEDSVWCGEMKCGNQIKDTIVILQCSYSNYECISLGHNLNKIKI